MILSLFFSSLQCLALGLLQRWSRPRTSEEELLDATLATVVESAIDSVFLVAWRVLRPSP